MLDKNLIIGLLLTFVSVCTGEPPEKSTANEVGHGQSGDDPSRRTNRQLERVYWQQAIAAREVEHDHVKAGHYFLHAGRLAAGLGDRQGLVDALHAARGVSDVVQSTFVHDAPVRSIVVAPNGKQVCTCSLADHAARIWSLESGKLLRVLRHDSGVVSAKFHPSGEKLLAVTYGGAVLWDLKNKKEKPLGVFNPHRDGKVYGPPSGAFFHPDSRHIVTLGRHPMLWLPGQAAPVLELKEDRGNRGATFHATTGQFLTWSYDGNVRLWRSEKGELLRTFKHPGPVGQAMFHPTSGDLITWSVDDPRGSSSSGRVWSLDKEEPVATLAGGHGNNSLEIHSDGKRALTWGTENLATSHAYLWSLVEHRQLFSLEHEAIIAGAVFVPNRDAVLTWANDGVLKFWSTKDGKLLQTFSIPRGVGGVRFDSVGDWLAVRDRDREVSVFRIPNPMLRSAFTRVSRPFLFRHETAVRGAEFLANDRLLTWSDDGSVRVWNLLAGQPAKLVSNSPNSGLDRAATVWIGRDNHLLTYQAGKAMKLWVPGSDEPIKTWDADDRTQRLIAISKEDDRVLTGGPNETVYLWSGGKDSPNGPVKKWQHDKRIVGGTFLRHGGLMMTRDSNSIQVHATMGDQPQRVFHHDARINQVQILPDHRRLLVSTFRGGDGGPIDGHITVWSLESDEPIHTIGDTGKMHLHADGRRVFVWQGDRTLSLWPLDGKGKPRRFEIPLGETQQFDDRCKLLLSSTSVSRQAWLWSLESGELLKQFHRRKPGGHFVDQDLFRSQLHPSGNYVVTWGSQPYRGRGRLHVWSVAGLDQPAITYDFHELPRNVILHPDGTMLVQLRDRILALSLTAKRTLARFTQHRYALRQMYLHPESSELFAINTARQSCHWNYVGKQEPSITQWLQEFETRTGMTIDHEGEYRRLTYDEWQEIRKSVPTP